MRETRTSGSVRDGAGNVPIYSASGFDDTALPVESVVAAVVIGLQDALPVTQETLGMDPLAVRGIVEDDDGVRRIALAAIDP